MTAHAFQHQPTGEVKVELEGATLEDLFTEAARAIAELVGKPTDDPQGPWVHHEVGSVDPHALLVAWMNELIERTEVDHLLYSDVEVEELTATQIRVRIRGTPIAHKQTTIVSATLHGMKIQAGGRLCGDILEVQH
jgi:SHS2 domain-containing protein